MKKFIYLFLIAAFIWLIAVPVSAQTQDRRIILDRYDCDEPAAESGDEDSNCLVELIGVYVADQKIVSGKVFTADENWLKNLKVKIKNVSGKPFVFVGVSFGLIEGLYEELAPSASWAWGFGLYRGKQSNPRAKKKKISKTVVLKPNEETELTFADLPNSYTNSRFMQVVKEWNKIVLITATVEFKDGRQEDSHIFIK